MKAPSEKSAIPLIADALAEMLDVGRKSIKITVEPRFSFADAIIKSDPFTFLVEYKGLSGLGTITLAAEQASRYASELGKGTIPLIVVPFMGNVGRERCAEIGVSWMDFSGNARISAPGLRVLIEGRPNRFKRSGRPSTIFAPKRSRIARWMLMHPNQSATQREIARATGMDEGYTSRIVARLEDDTLIIRDKSGAIKPRDPNLLLDQWREVYDFSMHNITLGHIPARTGDELLRRLAEALTEASVEYAATGLAAAWLMNRFVNFRLVTVYLRQELPHKLLEGLSFREDTNGANVWLVAPNDEGVFQGSDAHEGVRCVHPVQVYLDLKGQPERSREAAERLRIQYLNWKEDGR